MDYLVDKIEMDFLGLWYKWTWIQTWIISIHEQHTELKYIFSTTTVDFSTGENLFSTIIYKIFNSSKDLFSL